MLTNQHSVLSLNSVLVDVKAVVAAFNQEKALVGAFSVITNLRMELFEALVSRAVSGLVLSNLELSVRIVLPPLAHSDCGG